MRAVVTASLRAKRALCRESIRLAALLLSAVVAPAAADALVVPCHEVGGELFPSVTRSIEVVATRMTVDLRSETSDPRIGTLDAEIHLRNRTGAVLEACLLVPDDAANTALTWTWARGVVVASASVKPGFDPAQQASQLAHARHLRLPMGPGEVVVLRVERPIILRSEGQGRTGLALPTQLLRSFEGPVETAALEVVFAERPVALQNTLSSMLIYDDPDPRTRWFIRNWSPSIPFELHWWTPWAALTRVAEVEKCPLPTALIQAANKGPEPAAALVSKTPPQLLPVCASLPTMLRGGPVAATHQDGFAAMTLARYADGGTEVPLYRVNPAFEADSLSEAEQLYERLVAP